MVFPDTAPATAIGRADARRIEQSLHDTAARFERVGDAIDGLQVALHSGDVDAVARASRSIALLTQDTSSDYLLPIDQIEAAINVSSSEAERDRLHAAAERVAGAIDRVLTSRAAIGTLAEDLMRVNGEMLDVVRHLDSGQGTYDRTSGPRDVMRARGVLDASA